MVITIPSEDSVARCPSSSVTLTGPGSISTPFSDESVRSFLMSISPGPSNERSSPEKVSATLGGSPNTIPSFSLVI